MIGWIKKNKSWIFSGIGVAILTTSAGFLFFNKSNKVPVQDFKVQEGSKNIQAGRDVNITNISRDKNDGELEITKIRFTQDSEFDVLLRNIGDTAIIISKIVITMVKIHSDMIEGKLNPSASYRIPVDNLKEGESRSLDISHFIDPRKSDRIIIALETTKGYTLNVTFHYNKNKKVSFERRIWEFDFPSPSDLTRFTNDSNIIEQQQDNQSDKNIGTNGISQYPIERSNFVLDAPEHFYPRINSIKRFVYPELGLFAAYNVLGNLSGSSYSGTSPPYNDFLGMPCPGIFGIYGYSFPATTLAGILQAGHYLVGEIEAYPAGMEYGIIMPPSTSVEGITPTDIIYQCQLGVPIPEFNITLDLPGYDEEITNSLYFNPFTGEIYPVWNTPWWSKNKNSK